MMFLTQPEDSECIKRDMVTKLFNLICLIHIYVDIVAEVCS